MINVDFIRSVFFCVGWKFSWVHLNEGRHHDNKNRFSHRESLWMVSFNYSRAKFLFALTENILLLKTEDFSLFDLYQVWKCFVSNQIFFSSSLLSMLFWNICADVEYYSFGTLSYFPIVHRYSLWNQCSVDNGKK